MPSFLTASDATPSPSKLRALYNGLDPHSLPQHLAFYELYPDTSFGRQSLQEVGSFVWGTGALDASLLKGSIIEAWMALVNRPAGRELPRFDGEVIESLVRLSTMFPHAALKGHSIWSERELWALPSEEIDVARALLLTHPGMDRELLLSYEALLDFMALQIRLSLQPSASPQETIARINAFLFDDQGFRFPPHSLHSKEIDRYTFLPSVLDSRRGVCLGISLLYLCLAQRLQLPLEMITPPGHIYVRYRSGSEIINIETTARGIHLDCKEYLGVNTRALQQRTLREVIGMVHFNQASVHWQGGEYAKALEAYKRAEPYLGDDLLLKEFMGYLFLLTGEREEGERRLRKIRGLSSDYLLVKETFAEDYFLGQVDAEGIATLFLGSEEDRSSLLHRKRLLEETLARCPRFRGGFLGLAGIWLQLHRSKEAMAALRAYQSLGGKDPDIHYGLSTLYLQQRDFPHAWFHLQQAEEIVREWGHEPCALIELRRELLNHAPE